MITHQEKWNKVHDLATRPLESIAEDLIDSDREVVALQDENERRWKVLREAYSKAADIAASFDNCGTDADPRHTIPCEIAEAIRALGSEEV